MGPNSIVRWRKSFWRVTKKKSKTSNKLTRFFYMYTKYFLSTEYKGKLPLPSHGQKKKVNTLDDCDSDSEVMLNAEDKDWVENVNFGSI